MATQQDIFAFGSKNHLPMMSKDDYVQWSSIIIRYYKSKPNGKLLAISILEGPYEYRQIQEPSDETCTPLVPSSSRLRIEDEHTENERNNIEANEIRATRLAKTHDPLALYSRTPALLALLANTPQQPTYPSPVYTHEQPLPLNNIIVQQPSPNNNNNNFMHQQPIIDTTIDVNDPMQMQMVAVNAGNQRNMQSQNVVNHKVGYNAWQNGNSTVGNPQGNVSTPLIGNNENGHKVNQIRCYNYRGLEQHDFLTYDSDETWTLLLFMTQMESLRLELFQAHDQESEATHQFNLEDNGLVRFRNDHVDAFQGYVDLQQGNIWITRVNYVEALGHNTFSVK
ncbi:hypothetical protein Tco_1431148 [Tanacetum coccineum]